MTDPYVTPTSSTGSSADAANAAAGSRAALIGIFDDRLEAEKAVRDLEAAGFDNDQIGYAIRGSEVVRGGIG